MAATSSSYPPPPPFYRLYKDYATDPTSAPEPPPPIDGAYPLFGANYTTDVVLPTLEDQGVRQLYPKGPNIGPPRGPSPRKLLPTYASAAALTYPVYLTWLTWFASGFAVGRPSSSRLNSGGLDHRSVPFAVGKEPLLLPTMTEAPATIEIHPSQ